MISLNLLPPEEKKQANTKKYYLLIKGELITIFVVTILITVATFGSKLILAKQLTQVNKQLSLINPIQLQSRQQIITYNKKINKLKEIQNEFIPWSSIIWEVLKEIPENITVNSLNLDIKSKTLIDFLYLIKSYAFRMFRDGQLCLSASQL